MIARISVPVIGRMSGFESLIAHLERFTVALRTP